MPWTSEELAGWAEDIGLPQESQKAVLDALGNEAVRNKIAEGQLRQSDYDRAMNEQKVQHAKAQEEAEAAKAEHKAKTAELNKWYQTEAPRIDKAAETLRAEQERAVVLETRLRAFGTQYGIDEKELGLSGDPPPSPDLASRTPDLSGFATKDDLAQHLAALRQSPAVAARMVDAAAKHQRLFGKLPENTAAVTDEALEILSKNPADFQGLDAFLAEKFGFVAQEEVLAKAQRDEELDKVRAETREAVLSEVSAAGGQAPIITRDGEGASPVLAHLDNFRPGNSKPVADSPNGVNAAVQAYRDGTYRATP